MSTVTTTAILTIAEFDALPDDEDDREFELHDGELVEREFTSWEHGGLQARIDALLEALLSGLGEVYVEIPFQISTTPLQSKRRADVGFITHEHQANVPRNGWLEGAPDLVVEVLSPSDKAMNLHKKARLFLANGAREFWVVDPETQTISVRRQDHTSREYEPGDTIPLCFGEGSLAVADVFQDL